MAKIGRFLGGIAALIRSSDTGKYLLLKRSDDKDFGAGAWECVTGRVDQGEGFEDAVRREVLEELGAEVQVEFIIGTTHFYRGTSEPENELIGVIYGCVLEDPDAVRVSAEHSEFLWLTAEEAVRMLTDRRPSTEWLLRIIERAEVIHRLAPPELVRYHRETGFELG
jgi:8-oxo-dGTP pyrophosphatase MutT (NUDIX family)